MDTQPAINLEVIVPRIMLPSIFERSAATEEEQSALVEEKSEHPDIEQVRLFPINMENRPPSSSKQNQQGQSGDLITYTTRQGPFHLFRIEHILAHGPAYLLQVLRRGKAGSRTNHNQEKDSEPYRVTDELAFTLKFRHSTGEEATEAAQETLTPGWKQVVIVLDEENVPTNYNIDGSER